MRVSIRSKSNDLLNADNFIILNSAGINNETVETNDHKLIIKKSGNYTLSGSYFIGSECPHGISFQIFDITNNKVLYSCSVVKNKFSYNGNLTEKDNIAFRTNYYVKPKSIKMKLNIKLDEVKSDEVKLDGVKSSNLSSTNSDVDVFAQLLNNIAYDESTKIQWISSVPPTASPCPNPAYEPQTLPSDNNPSDTLPGDIMLPGGLFAWTANTIPWRVGQQSQNFDPVKQTGLFANLTPYSPHAYNKHQSIAYVLAFYAGLDFETIPKNSDSLTIFAKDFDQRGGNNMDKLQYMYALTSDKLHYYEPKIDALLNTVYNLVKDGTKPLISTFTKEMVKFFIDVHVGKNDDDTPFPDYMVSYFTNFVKVVGFVRNGNVNTNDFNYLLTDGRRDAVKVRKFYENRAKQVIKNKDTSCIAYHWNDSGLALESLITESLHNIIAFIQFINVLHRVAVDKYWATVSVSVPKPHYIPDSVIPKIIIPGIGQLTGPVNFFAKRAETNDKKEHLNIVREVYRLLTPNGNAFSKLEIPDANGDPLQARHLWALIMIAQEKVPDLLVNVPSNVLPDTVKKTISYFTYKPQIYNKGGKYNTSLEPIIQVPNTTYVLDHLTFSDVDNDPTYNDGTVIDKSNPKIIPVTGNKGNNLETPHYPFGMGYRSCPGQIFSYFFTDKLLAKFSNLTWEFRDPGKVCDSGNVNMDDYVCIGPRNAVFDNLYVKV